MSYIEERAGLEAVTEELENLDTTDSDDTAVENHVENIEFTDAEDTPTPCDTPSIRDTSKNCEESECAKAVSVGESEIETRKGKIYETFFI